jgi:hypothetical protein
LNVKAQGLLNAAKWIEEQYGQEALRDVVRACSPELRDRYISAIAINWHPVSELIELLETADRLLGRGDGKIAEEIGAAGARSNMKGVFVRLLFYVGRPEFLMRRIAQLWRQYNDQGEMILASFDDFTSTLEVSGVPHPNWHFCCTITGWSREVALAMGAVNPSVRHTDCRSRGAEKCIWHLRWTMSATDLAKKLEEDTKAKK